MQYMEAQLKRVGTPGPRVIGVDEISIRKGHSYRIVVSDLLRGRPIWFGGEDRSEASMSQFYAWLGEKKSSRIRLAVMDMWKPFRLATNADAPQAAILFDKFHVIRHLGEALDAVRKSEYGRLQGRQRRYIKGQKYTLLSRKENLSLEGKKALSTTPGGITGSPVGVGTITGHPPSRFGLAVSRQRGHPLVRSWRKSVSIVSRFAVTLCEGFRMAAAHGGATYTGGRRLKVSKGGNRDRGRWSGAGRALWRFERDCCRG
jgi:Transposase